MLQITSKLSGLKQWCILFFLMMWNDWEVLLLVLPGLPGAAAGRGSTTHLVVLAVGWRALVLFHVTSHPPG